MSFTQEKPAETNEISSQEVLIRFPTETDLSIDYKYKNEKGEFVKTRSAPLSRLVELGVLTQGEISQVFTTIQKGADSLNPANPNALTDLDVYPLPEVEEIEEDPITVSIEDLEVSPISNS